MVQLPSITASARASRPLVASDRAGEASVLLSLQGNEPVSVDKDGAPTSSTRKPIDLCIVLDKSGSMSGDKLTQCKDTLTFLVTRVLTAGDRLALVTFDSNVTVNFPLTNLTPESKAKCLTAVQQVHAGSNTNLSGGLFRGLQLLLEQHEWAERCGVCLLTDGQLNEGVTDQAKLLAMLGTTLGKFAAGGGAGVKRAPPSVMCFGYGKDASVDILSAIATASGGNYYSVLSSEAVPLAFTDALGGLLAVVAQNVSVKVTVDGASSLSPLSKFEFSQPSPTTALLNLKDLYGGEKRDLLFRVGYSPSPSSSSGKIAVRFEVVYMDVVREELGAKAECECTMDRVPSSSIPSTLVDDVEVVRHELRWDATVALEEARKTADTGDLSGGTKRLDKALEHAQARMKDLGVTEECDDMMAELNTDMRSAQVGMRSQSTYGQARGKIAAAVFSHGHQRSNKTEEFMESKSSAFMMDAGRMAGGGAGGAPKPSSSAYSVPAKNRLMTAAKEAFNLQ